MSCANEIRKRNTYENVSRLAKMSLELVQDDIVVYRKKDKANEYAFCCQCEWAEEKGIVIKVLRKDRGH